MRDRLPHYFQNIAFIAMLCIVTFALGYVLRPFFFAIFWAVLLASVFAPVYKSFQKKIKNPNLCASATLVVVLICLILPVGFLINLLILESIGIYHSLNSGSSSWMQSFSALLDSLNRNPLFSRFHIDQAFLIDKSQEALKALTGYVFSHISDFTQNTIVIIVDIAVMLYSLFYFLRDGEKMVNMVKKNIPVDKKHLDHFIDQFFNTAQSALKFTFVIGGIQGLLGGLAFYFTGIDRALIWGVLMMGFSVVPAVGSAIIWAPAGLIMLFQGYIWQGIAILFVGAVVISSVDNLLRPVLMGRDTQMNSLMIFLSTLGGIATLGFSGFVLGPVIASLFVAVWKIFPEVFQKQIQER